MFRRKMQMNQHDDATLIRQEIDEILRTKIIPFWLQRSVDEVYGGYLTSFDENGRADGKTDKYIVTQCRMVWGFSHLLPYADVADRPAMLAAAGQGVKFLIDRFWDNRHGGFAWQVARNGTVLDSAKLVYGESFAIYAFSEYFLQTGDRAALHYAERTFDLLQVHAADTLNGGYYENLEADWSRSPGGFAAGDRKSLDIHMHLMEAFTTLYQATQKDIHRRKLSEVVCLILRHMVNREAGYGYNQFDAAFNKLPAININRTWNAERETNETIGEPTDTTSYGHNVELSWLMGLALQVLEQQPGALAEDGAAAAGLVDRVILQRLLDHSLQFGYDHEFGGVYRDGVADQKVLVTDKEWWQNFESLVGYLNGYRQYGQRAYWAAFVQTWRFVKEKFLNLAVGESRQLLDRRGTPIVANLGNPWKGIYHTGRALAECLDRL